jgi:hypothetical protein
LALSALSALLLDLSFLLNKQTYLVVTGSQWLLVRLRQFALLLCTLEPKNTAFTFAI